MLLTKIGCVFSGLLSVAKNAKIIFMGPFWYLWCLSQVYWKFILHNWLSSNFWILTRIFYHIHKEVFGAQTLRKLYTYRGWGYIRVKLIMIMINLTKEIYFVVIILYKLYHDLGWAMHISVVFVPGKNAYPNHPSMQKLWWTDVDLMYCMLVCVLVLVQLRFFFVAFSLWQQSHFSQKFLTYCQSIGSSFSLYYNNYTTLRTQKPPFPYTLSSPILHSLHFPLV